MISSNIIRALNLTKQSTRNTWVLKRVFTPESTPPGGIQKNPNDFHDYQKYETVEVETLKAAGPIRVILLEDVEGIGHQFDVVNIDRTTARKDLLLSKKAVYASPYDLKYYSAMKERMADELAARVRIPYEFKTVGRDLQKLVVPIKVNMENKWEINRKLMKSSLRQMGVFVAENTIHLAEKQITGPNFELEAKLIRFYLVINQQYIVPMLGRISHISVDDSKQTLSSSLTTPKDEELLRFNIRKEYPLYTNSQEFTEDFPVFQHMRENAPLKPQ
ncbi:unnamed protein product [Caenorhabditis angaria]|uniref:Large ribosomal subunit protein bL9m n=1 Tax=Caenorhabditis angaria TaxID=860376 RepID=A0A9P1I5M9_9PELO|nr:unnamed protein product [Caenorhabditis angaria]